MAIAPPRSGNGQEYKWFLFPGTVVKATGTQRTSGNDFVRIELDSGQVAWVLRRSSGKIHFAGFRTQSPVTPSPRTPKASGEMRIVPGSGLFGHSDPDDRVPPAYLVEEGDKTLSFLMLTIRQARRWSR